MRVNLTILTAAAKNCNSHDEEKCLEKTERKNLISGWKKYLVVVVVVAVSSFEAEMGDGTQK